MDNNKLSKDLSIKDLYTKELQKETHPFDMENEQDTKQNVSLEEAFDNILKSNFQEYKKPEYKKPEYKKIEKPNLKPKPKVNKVKPKYVEDDYDKLYDDKYDKYYNK